MSETQIEGELTFVADAFRAWLRRAVARQMALLTTVVALLGTTLGAVTRHMTDAAAGVTGLTPAATTTTATTVAATAAAIAALTAWRTTGGAITCYVTLTTTTVALTTAAAATSTAVGIPARTAPARATIATSTVARTTTANGAGLSAVTSKVRLASTWFHQFVF
jgi:hypothetical protein